MRDEMTWQPLRDALERMTDANHSACLWLRDDDAIEPSPALDRLLDLTRRASVPLSLAVIPAYTGEALADRLDVETHASVTVHGWSHENHAADHGKKRELGPDRPAEIVLGELRDGFGKLQALYPTRLDPVLVPPWNRIDAALLPQLPALGFRAVSVYGAADGDSPIGLINTHVDIMDWLGTRGCRPHAELVALLVAELEARIAGSDEPIGLLTHHLVHDEACWDFMARLFAVTAESHAVRWHPLRDLLPKG
jgi:hypothetical protein